MIKNVIDKNNFDLSVRPQDDLFLYVNGGWLKSNSIPPEETRWGVFNILRKESELALKDILESIKDTETLQGTETQKLKDYYSLAMNEEKLNQEGVRPLEKYLAEIEKINDPKTLMTYIAWAHLSGVGAFWGMGIDQDLKRSDVNTMYISQGGLGLPDRDYYFKDDDKSKEIIKKYLEYLQKLFVLLGSSGEDSEKSAEKVFEIEKRLASVSMNKTELRDIEKLYNKMTIAELPASKDWEMSEYFSKIGLPNLPEIIVTQPLFFQELAKFAQEESFENIKTYLRARLASSASSYLSDEFVNNSFDFYGRVLSGAKEMKPRWRRAVVNTDGVLGEALGKIYVEKHFGGDAKTRVSELVDNLVVAYRKRIEGLDWMGDETKEKALEKLNSVTRMLAYPEKWRDYTKLEVGTESYWDNAVKASIFEVQYNLNKYGKPVDRTEWHMTPPTVNAYYDPSNNIIAFPAGIMQPPFFDPNAPDALNYGSIGAVIGHELTHGFDDEGSKFDAKGNMENWWTEEDRKKFDERAEVLVRQFNEYIAIEDIHVNGKLTLGENIADLGGIVMAYYAFLEVMNSKGRPADADGFTPEQLFFVGWAQSWRENIRPEQARVYAMTDLHSPDHHRTNGPISNMTEFYEAFEVKEGDALWRPEGERAKIW
jgi:putative endopeptidase